MMAKKATVKKNLIAEPMHRVPPPRATSGMSLRTFSKSSLEMVREVCFFYVRKCSGKYEHNQAAARYVHQMAEEILSLLGGVINEIEKQKEHPEILQSLLDEWNANFPASLRSYGSPRTIASLIESQSKELEGLRSDLAVERSQRLAAEEQLSVAMNEQLQLYKNTFLRERKERMMAAESAEGEHERELAELHERYRTHASEMEKKFLDTFSLRQSEYSKTIAELRRKLRDADSCQQQMEARFEEEIAVLTESKDKEIAELSSRLQELLSNSRSAAKARRSPHRSRSSSSRSPKSTHSKIFSSPPGATTSTCGSIFSPALNPSPSSRSPEIISPSAGGAASPAAKEEEEVQARLQQLAAAIAEKDKEIERLHAKLTEFEEEVLVLREQVQVLVPREESLRRELLHMEILLEKVKKAVSNGLDKLPAGFRSGFTAASGEVVVLCHTPHFLGPPDRNQLSAARPEPKLVGYQTWGKF